MIDDIDANKILVSKEELYSSKNPFKYFIGIQWWWFYHAIMHRTSKNYWIS